MYSAPSDPSAVSLPRAVELARLPPSLQHLGCRGQVSGSTRRVPQAHYLRSITTSPALGQLMTGNGGVTSGEGAFFAIHLSFGGAGTSYMLGCRQEPIKS